MKVVRVITALAITFFAFNTVWGQAFLPNSTSRPAMTGTVTSGINLAPSNPLGMPVAYGAGPSRGSDIIPLSSGMLSAYMPTIPNLELGFQYYFGNKVRSGQVSGDYLLPYNLGNDAVVFGEAHGNYWDFAQKPPGGASHRVDLSLGGGYRKIVSNQLLVGINGFYDTSRLFSQWYSSGSVGLEMAANMGSSDAIDLNANWYGDLFASNSIVNAFRNQGSSYDIEAGYSHALFNQAMDLRLKFAGYHFDVGNSVYGYKTGADLTTKNGMFTLRYEYGNDKINGYWNNIGAFVNVGFQLENIVKGESPVSMPEPIFKSPRNLRRMLTQKVKRDWDQAYAPGRAALASAAVGGCSLGRDLPTIVLNDLNQFAAVDHNLLTGDLFITVKFTYANASGGEFVVFVGNGLTLVFSSAHTLTGGDTVTWVLCRSDQQVFYTNNANPTGVIFSGPNDGTTFTDVRVCFNQPGALCPP